MEYSGILSSFPPGILYAFAYGSAAFQQSHEEEEGEKHIQAAGDNNKKKHNQNEEGEEKMLDLVFVVRDSLSWHRENLIRNPSHYSLLGSAGPHLILWIQRRVKAFIYFNVVMDMRMTDGCDTSSSCVVNGFSQSGQCNLHHHHVTSMKYGVIQYEDLVRDLRTWDCLYVAGRLHKPVHVMVNNLSEDNDRSSELVRALRQNERAGVAASLLLLMVQDSFTEDQLFTTIAGLSYFGDFRMIIGEDRAKVRKIVHPQKHHFRKMYMGILEQDLLVNESYVYDPVASAFHIPFTRSLIIRLISSLPDSLIQDMGGMEYLCHPLFHRKEGTLQGKEGMRQVRQELSHKVKKCITSITWRSSLCQGIKGFFTTGFLKAIKYMCRKMNKMYLSIGVRGSLVSASPANTRSCNNNQ